MENNENMGKVQLNTLPKRDTQTTELILKNGERIQVEKFVSYEKVFDMIEWALTFVMDDRAYVSGPVFKVVQDFAIVKYYTNIDLSFIEGIEVDPRAIYENYDLLANAEVEGGGWLLDSIREVVDQRQLEFFKDAFEITVENIVKNRDSARGVVDALAEASKVDSEKLNAALADMDDESKMEQVKKIMNFYTENS